MNAMNIVRALSQPFALPRVPVRPMEGAIDTEAEKAVQPVKIDIRNLSVFYGKFRAIAEITLAIPAHQITAIIGPSGCGKSTLLRAINRMTDLTTGSHAEGEILLDGEDILAPGIDVVQIRQRVGMVFQRPNPFPKSIYDNVAYGPRLYGIRRRAELDEIVEHSLERAALWDEVKDKLHQSGMALSGGQQQRLCIARALAVEPAVILMDEPASALDPIATLKIEDLMQHLKEEYTIVIVTHNMQQAARVSDMTSYFLLGELIESGPTTQIFTAPRQTKTEQYITGRFG